MRFRVRCSGHPRAQARLAGFLIVSHGSGLALDRDARRTRRARDPFSRC